MTDCSIVRTGVVCSIGAGAPQLSASFRCGLSGYVESALIDGQGRSLTMALVPDVVLDPLALELDSEPLSDRERSMLRLAGTALRQIAPPVTPPCPVFLALPERRPACTNALDPSFLEKLGIQAGIRFNDAASECFELGRAGGMHALRAGIAALESGRQHVLVGGVDTYIDLRLLADLEPEKRLLVADVKDGFVPGEAAAFLLLSRMAAEGATVVRAVGTAEDPGHRYSEEPALGEGLSAALEDAIARHGEQAQVRTCFSGLNGESFGAKEWGVAQLRHHALFDAALQFEHPGDSFGDVGAAMAPLLVALADETSRAGHRSSPMLVWASSDREPCGCAFLATA